MGVIRFWITKILKNWKNFIFATLFIVDHCKRPHPSTYGPPAVVSCLCRVIAVRCSVVGPFLWPARRPGTHYQTTFEIRRVLLTVFDVTWKLFFSRSISVHSPLGASPLCAIQIYYWHRHWQQRAFCHIWPRLRSALSDCPCFSLCSVVWRFYRDCWRMCDLYSAMNYVGERNSELCDLQWSQSGFRQHRNRLLRAAQGDLSYSDY